MAMLNSQRVTYITQNSFAYEKQKRLQDSRLGIFFGNQHAEIQAILGFRVLIHSHYIRKKAKQLP